MDLQNSRIISLEDVDTEYSTKESGIILIDEKYKLVIDLTSKKCYIKKDERDLVDFTFEDIKFLSNLLYKIGR